MEDLSSERAVLASVFKDGIGSFANISDIISVNSFTDKTNQNLWKCFEYLLKDESEVKSIDYPTLISAASSLGLAKSIEADTTHLRSIMKMADAGLVKQESVRRLAGRLRKLEFARKTLNTLDGIKDELNKVTGDESIDQIISTVENPVFDLSLSLATSSGENPQRIGEGLGKFLDFVSKNQRDTIGISTGYEHYDTAIGGGLRPGVSIIGSRAKIGKTQLADNVSYFITGKLGYPVLNCDTEMSKEDHWVRMLANISSVTVNEIESGKFSNDPIKKQKVQKAKEILDKIPYDYKSIAGQPFEETVALMRRWVMKTVGLNSNGHAKPCAIVFDYLKLMSSDSMQSTGLQEYQVLGFMMTGLHNFAQRYKVPILAFVQLNRDGIDKEDTSAISGSDRILWLCNNFSIFKPKSSEEIAEQVGMKIQYNRKLVPLSVRHGAGLPDGDYINMFIQGEFGRIREGPTRFEAESGINNGSTNGGFVVDGNEESVF